MKNYSGQHALILPGRVPGFKSALVQLLPCSDPKANLYRKYIDHVEQEHKVSYSTFTHLWRKYFPNIVTQKPRSDLCKDCNDNMLSMSNMNNMPEEKKLALIEKSHNHLQLVSAERAEYK